MVAEELLSSYSWDCCRRVRRGMSARRRDTAHVDHRQMAKRGRISDRAHTTTTTVTIQ
jgi:hypothetical protein